MAKGLLTRALCERFPGVCDVVVDLWTERTDVPADSALRHVHSTRVLNGRSRVEPMLVRCDSLECAAQGRLLRDPDGEGDLLRRLQALVERHVEVEEGELACESGDCAAGMRYRIHVHFADDSVAPATT